MLRVLRSGRPAAIPRAWRRLGLAAAASLMVLVGTRGTQDAVANGDTRTLSLYHNHTKESLSVTFRRNGQYDPRALEQLNWFLRDWRRDEPTRMDPRLFDTLWEVYRLSRSDEAIHVNSAYRSPHTNAMLRRRSSGVAKNSQHTRGKAMDFYLPDVPIERIRAIGMRLQDGGVGFYPNAYTPFVHLDVGSVRAWPRMTRDQLVRIFPDGKTVHIPTDGEPLPRYEEAKAEILAKGGSVGGYSAIGEDEGATVVASTTKRRGFWATLFGWADEDEDAEEIRVRPSRTVVAARRAPPPPAETSFDPSGDPGSGYSQAEVAQVRQPIRITQAEFERVQPAPRIAGSPGTVQTPGGPRLDWQQGPPSQVPTGSSSVAGLAFAPMPPRRPDDVVTTGALAFVPLPPARPGSLAAANPLPDAAPDLRAAPSLVAQASMPPLPPVRPGARTIVVASAEPMILSSGPVASISQASVKESRATLNPSAGGAITSGHPAAPRENRVQVSALSSGPVASAPQASPKDDRAQLDALFAATAMALSLSQAPKLGSVASASASAVQAGGFSSSPMGDLSTNRFSGPAVKQLATR